MRAEQTSGSVSSWARRSGEGLKCIISVAYHTGSQFPKMFTHMCSKFKHKWGTFQSSISMLLNQVTSEITKNWYGDKDTELVMEIGL